MQTVLSYTKCVIMVKKANRYNRRITMLHVRILEALNDRDYMHSNEIYSWVSQDVPSPAMFLMYLEELEELGYIRFEIEKGYIRTHQGTATIKKIRGSS